MKPAIAIALGLAIVWGAQAGCSTKVCTVIGCPLPFEILFAPQGGLWARGTYLVSVTADGRSGHCAVTLPFPSCAGPAPVCESERDWQLNTSGCALPEEQHGISGIMFGIGSAPATVEIAISRGDQRLAARTFTPTFRTYEPNGPGCGDVCTSAPAATLSVER